MSEGESIELDTERSGEPAHVEATAEDSVGLLRLQFPDTKRDHDELEPISWDAFFEKFEETEGDRMSRFYKFVDRESV